MASVDLYNVLQVTASAEPEVVRAAYRALARKHHPDAGGEARVMAALNAAWHILGSPELRAAYDAERARAAAVHASVARSPQPEYQPQPSPIRPAPPGTGIVLDFGRYAGWSIGSLAGTDPDYLEWLARTPIGRPYRREIEAALASQIQHAAALRPQVAGRTAHQRAANWFSR